MRFRRPSHATVVAYLALLTALGGSAYAASKIGTSDIKRNAVTSPKIDNFTIKAKDLKRLRIRTERIVTPPDTQNSVFARCKKNERAIGGAGGWGAGGGVIFDTDLARGGFGVKGRTSPTVGDTISAQALCMRK